MENTKKERIEIVRVRFPKDIRGSYSVVNTSTCKKRVELEFIFVDSPKMMCNDKVVLCISTNGEVREVEVPFFYVGRNDNEVCE